MEFIKLQLGCLAIVLFITVGYLRETVKKKGETTVKCNPIFDLLLFFSPWAIVFDGVTAWTVNHQNIVPPLVNHGLHLLFYLLMHGVIVLTFLYFYDITIGLPTKKSKLLLHLLPSIVASVVVVAFIGKIYYVDGKITNYSMGISAIVCYASMAFHYGYILVLLAKYHRNIEKRNKISVLFCVLLGGLCFVVQVIFKESLISAIFPTLMLLGIYFYFENPALIHLQNNNREMVSAFATVVETRDGSTGGHIKRTREYVRIILAEMAKKKKFKHILTKDYRSYVENAAPLHDIGKVATPDVILLKPGRLTDEEFSTMKEHAAKGGELIEKTLSNMNNPEFEKIAYEVARYHHEKWNGRGYPEGLCGENIPLHARIMAIADVFDAVSEKRCYRDAMPLEKCFGIIEEGAGKDFDPELAALFLGAREQVTKTHYKVNSEIR